ncbi:BQ5605_C012g06753 [Microbotryum silenes-dioicae]|uniref:BQ5605_C012g06753 protein n=1 Tax=Microbotryum silenes-dioicae TaxID=796604 RepID=A0A2X0LVJ9_9BASI|nr:BQ5605_C012g06753 [Microbotryum silenes-dioicae]
MARVDVEQRTWSVFNSLSNVRIDEITRNSALALFDYLELRILNTEPKQGRMVQQADSFSCGPAAINVVETELLLVPPFSAGRAHISRIRQFHRLATFAIKSQDLTHDLPAPIAGIDKNDLDVGVFEEMAEMEVDEETWSEICFSSDSETDDDCTTDDETPKPGESITARRARLAKEHLKDIEYSKARPAAFAEFKAKVKQLCPGSDVKIANPRTVQCGRCRTYHKMKTRHGVNRFMRHINQNPPCTNMRKVDHYFAVRPPAETARVERYLSKSSARGGGAPSRLKLIKRRFPRLGKRVLTPSERREINNLEANEWKWVNDHSAPRVNSIDCTKIGVESQCGTKSQPCAKCKALLRTKAFPPALYRPRAVGPTIKFTNKRLASVDALMSKVFKEHQGLEELLGTKDGKIYHRYAQGLIVGELAGANILKGMAKVAVIKHRRNAQGKDMRGYVRDEALLDFEHALALASPTALRVVQKTIGGISMRTLQQHRATFEKPRFGLDEPHMQRVVQKILSDGKTFNLHVEDTKLRQVIRTTRIYSKDKEAEARLRGQKIFRHELIGMVGPPIVYETTRELEGIFRGPNPPIAGTKVRVYMLAPNDVSCPAQYLAAFVIGDSTSSSEAADELESVIQFLVNAELGHLLASISADGAASEGVLQRVMAKRLGGDEGYTGEGNRRRELAHVIPSPGPDKVFPAIRLASVQVGNTPTCFNRDEKHLSKNLRSACDSGARAIYGGTGCIGYRDLLTLLDVEESARTLYLRDVVGRDRQDDNATHRAFSEATLSLACRLHEDGKVDADAIVFLFLCGELHDAIQNRSLQPIERIKMLLTVRYTFEGWLTFERNRPGYNAQSFVAKETLDGMRKVVDTNIALIRNYRDFWPEEAFIPWRHGTEMVEHFFGGLRKVVQEFDALEFLQSASKVTALLGLMRKLKTETAGSRQGYHHTYDRLDDLDLVAMRTYPNDEEIQSTSLVAAGLAKELLLGLRMWDTIHYQKSNQVEEEIPVNASEPWHFEPEDTEPVSYLADLDRTLNGIRTKTCQGLVVLDPKERKLAVQQAYDEADAQAEERFLLDAIETANESLPGRAQILRLPSLLRHDTRQLALDLKSLTEHRRAHQCAHLKVVLLKGKHGAPTSTAQDFDQKRNLQSMGAARLEAVSGVARSIRWTGQGTFSRFSTANETDNIGYIEDGRKEVRMQLRARQYTVFAKIPTFGSIDGNVTSAMPLKIGSFVCFGLKRGIIPVSCDASNIGEDQLSIGLVRYMYAKATSNHCDRAETDSLALLSNVVLQELRVVSKGRYSTHMIDGTTRFFGLDARHIIQSLESSSTPQAEARFCFLRRYNGLRDASVSLSNQMKGVKDVGSKRKAASADKEPSAKQNRTG